MATLMVDMRREVREIWKHYKRYHADVGETIIYYRFAAKESDYDDVYDEGYRRYHKGVRIGILWVDQSEAPEDYSPEGRRPTMRIRLAVSAQDLYEAGVSVTEAHGNRITDVSPNNEWRDDRVHDMFYYDNRYWEVSSFQIRGRAKGEDVIIGITGIETFPDDDMLLDFQPSSLATTTPLVVGGAQHGHTATSPTVTEG
jgi:hypothetical protein